MAAHEVQWVLGMMSGTSLDGVDAAMLLTDGRSILSFGSTAYRPYDAALQTRLRAALGSWDPDPALGRSVVEEHLACIAEISEAPAPALIGFHGQTIAHEPAGRGTLQIGSGLELAMQSGIETVWDFRSADVALGGQGAPLASFYHHALARYIGADAPTVFLNLGGVGNLTWVDPSIEDPAEAGACIAFDTGPANAPINDLVAARLGQPFDRNARLARKGKADMALVAKFLERSYFKKMPPKSLDRNDFADCIEAVDALGDADAAATLTALAAASVARGMEHCPRAPGRVLVSGGGRKNPLLMAMLDAGVDARVEPVEAVGLDGDMIEAQAFAFLAARVKRGLPTSSPTTTGVSAAVGGGQISAPGRRPKRECV